MQYVETKSALGKLIEGVVTDSGCKVYDIERLGPASLRISIEKAPGALAESQTDGSLSQAGVSSRDCTSICRKLSVIFAVEGKQHGLGDDPELDVCSPGINRDLRLPQHFEAALGERVKLVLLAGAEVLSKVKPEVEQASLQGESKLEVVQKQFSDLVGQLKSCSGDYLWVLEERTGTELGVKKSSLKRARLDCVIA